MAFTPPPPIPQRGARSSFSGAVDAFLRWMAGLPAQLDAFLAQLSTLAAGGANSFPYVFDSNTALGDPTGGKLRLNSATQNASTELRIDPVLAGNMGAIAGLLFDLTTANNSRKASLRIQKRGDPTKWLIFDITSGTGSGLSYFNFTVICTASSAPSPFATGDDIMVYIDKIGDKGDVGNADKKVQTAPAPVGGTVTIDYRNGNCVLFNPAAASTSTINVTNWPAAGTLGEMWIIGTNLGAATAININGTVSWLRPDGTYAANTSMTTNGGVALRASGEDNVFLWGRSGAPDRGKVAR